MGKAHNGEEKDYEPIEKRMTRSRQVSFLSRKIVTNVENYLAFLYTIPGEKLIKQLLF